MVHFTFYAPPKDLKQIATWVPEPDTKKFVTRDDYERLQSQMLNYISVLDERVQKLENSRKEYEDN